MYDLRVWRGSIEQRWRGVSEPLARHQVVALDDGLEVIAVYADGYSHEHVLGTLNNFAIHSHQICALPTDMLRALMGDGART